MEFTFLNTDQLKREISLAASVVEKKATIPALQNLCLEPLSNNQIKVTSTGLNISISTSIDIINFVKKESGLINAKALNDLLLNIPTNQECKLKQTENSWFEFTAGRTKRKLPGQARSEYPEVDKHNLSDPIELPAIKFASLIDKTSIAISTDEQQRFALQGCQFIIENGKALMVTTDGHRLALAGFSFAKKEGLPDETIKVLIPKKALAQLSKMLSSITDSKDSVKIPDFFFSYSDKQLCFQLGSKTLYSITLSGQFPNYSLIMPKEINHKATVNTEDCKLALKRTLLTADEKSQGVKLIFNDGSLEMATKASEKGETQESLDIDYNSSKLDTGINGNYLLDVLNKIDTKEFTVGYKDQHSQALFEPVGSTEIECKYIVMGMRLDK